MKIGQFCENPIFLGSFALFSTMTPFFDTFFGSLGVEKRATTGVSQITFDFIGYGLLPFKEMLLSLLLLSKQSLTGKKNRIS